MSNIERDYWDNAATDPDVAKKYISDVATDDCLEGVLPFLRPYSVLEIGCGIGRLTTAIAELRPEWQLHGIDISTNMIAQTPKSKVKYSVNNGRTIPHAAESFDSVYSMLVFQHIPDEAKVGYIKEAYRVLKENGVLRVQYIVGDFHNVHDHNATEDSMVAWFKDAGFKVTDVSIGNIHHQWGWITGVK